METVSHRPRDRKALVREAGLGTTSLVSIVAGTAVAIGAVALLLSAAAGIGEAVGVDTDGLNGDDWRNIGIVTAAAFAIALLLAYYFGGYVAGRMARRAGARHGLGVLVLGLAVTVGIAALADYVGDTNAFVDDLRNQGVPTAADDWSGVGLGAAVAALAAMVVGSLFGGMRGERWHGRLEVRAADPNILPRDEERRREKEVQERAEETRKEYRRHDRDGDGIDDRAEEAQEADIRPSGSERAVVAEQGQPLAIRDDRPDHPDRVELDEHGHPLPADPNAPPPNP